MLIIAVLVISRCDGLSESPRPSLDSAEAASTPAPSRDTATGDGWQQVGRSGVYRFVETSQRDPDALRVIVADTCGSDAMCKVGFWPSGSAPRAFPLSDANLAAQLAQYSRNLNTGLNAWQWSCEVNPAECDPASP